MSVAFDYIQTFYVDKNRVNDATDILITSVELFFKTAPESGNQGVTVWLCETSGDAPVPAMRLKKSISSLTKALINTDELAQASTLFTFSDPIVVRTGVKYGVVVKFDADGYSLWTNKKGDALLDLQGKTNNPSAGSTANFDGALYARTNSDIQNELTEEDLKFRINVAKFKSTSSTINLINRDYEFLTASSRTGAFTVGEWAYKNSANVGNITTSLTVNYITGTGLDSHTAGDRIVVSNGSVTDVLTLVSIANSTYAEVDKNPNIAGTFGYKVPPSGRVAFQDIPNKEVILDESNAANATFLFEAGDVITGVQSGATVTINSVDHKNVDLFNAKFRIGSPSIATHTLKYRFANTNNNIESSWTNFDLFQDNGYRREAVQKRIMSRSSEVVGSTLYGTRNKSAVVQLDFTINGSATNLFQAPFLDGDELDMITSTYDINSSSLTTRYGFTNYDSEVEKNGLARSKYISKKVSFAENRYAEDIDVVIGAYRPYGTNINVYARIHNSQDPEAFDDKAWSPLVLKSNADVYSVEENVTDLKEYSYGFPQYPEISETISVDLTNQSNSTVLTVGDYSSDFPAGTMIRLYDALLPDNHEVFKVVSSNSTSFTVNRDVDNVNIPANPAVDILKYKTTAWNNIANDNVVRYFTSTTNQEMDGFNTMQIKVVLLSESSHHVPKVEQVQAIAVSA